MCGVVVLFSLLLMACAWRVDAAYCNGRPSPDAQPNFNPIEQPSPVLISTVENGALYQVQVDGATVPIVHMWGTPYEKGYAHGSLMKPRVVSFMSEVWQYMIVQQGQQMGCNTTQCFQLAQLELQLALDYTISQTAPFTPAYFNEEIQGLADASGADAKLIQRIHMMGELTKGSCSMFGAWGPSVADNGLLTMRALDWIMDGPFQNYHQLSVYHSYGVENSFVNVGWTGWVGSLSGVSDAQLSIHEIGVSYPDASFGPESTAGIPFTYILRDMLQFDEHRLDALSRLASAHRTCDLILGVGDGKDVRFNSVQYGASVCGIMDDTNMKPVNATWHPTLPHTVYHGMDWLCPSFNAALHTQLKSYYGALTPALAIQYVMPIVQTGNLHIFLADLVNMQLYVSFSRPDNVTSSAQEAFARGFAQFDLQQLFDTPLNNEQQNKIDISSQ